MKINMDTKEKLIVTAKEFDKKAKSIISSISSDNYGEWLSEYTDTFFEKVSDIIGINKCAFEDTIFDDHPKINNTPVRISSDGNVFWNNEYGFENYGLGRVLDNIENYFAKNK